jgi:glutamine synthetase
MADESVHALEASGIRFVRVVWCDNANVIRAKAFHSLMLGNFYKHGVGITAASQALPVMADAVVGESGLGPVGEVRLIPDWSTLTTLPYAPGHARVIGDMVRDGRPWPLCPRDFLRRMLADAKRAGFEIVAAFENEFFLLRPAQTSSAAAPVANAPGAPWAPGATLLFEPIDSTVFCQSLAMDKARVVIDEITEALSAQGIAVEMYYPESGPGQQELTICHARGLAVADRQIVFRETVHAVALRHGLLASFLPKIFADKAGNGLHLHVSFWRGDNNLVPDSGGRWELSATTRAFMAGVLAHLPALMALTTPSPNSYRRLKPHFWSGAFRCWGLDNREAALRVPTSPEGPPSNFELKTCDGSANPYLALGGVVAAGLDGLRRQLELPEPVASDPGNLSDSERQQRGIDALPANLGEALDHFSKDAVLSAALGPELARAFLAVRWAEWQALKDMSLTDEVNLLLERY